jgi:hypothetical protein
MMKDTAQGLVEAFGNDMEILQGELTVIHLPVGEDLVNDLLHHALDAGRSGIDQRP